MQTASQYRYSPPRVGLVRPQLNTAYTLCSCPSRYFNTSTSSPISTTALPPQQREEQGVSRRLGRLPVREQVGERLRRVRRRRVAGLVLLVQPVARSAHAHLARLKR